MLETNSTSHKISSCKKNPNHQKHPSCNASAIFHERKAYEWWVLSTRGFSYTLFFYLHYSFLIFIIFKYFLHVGLIFEPLFVIRMKWKVIGSCHFPHLKPLILLPGFPGCRNAHLVCSIRQLCIDFGRQESKKIPHKMNKNYTEQKCVAIQTETWRDHIQLWEKTRTCSSLMSSFLIFFLTYIKQVLNSRKK